MASAVVILASSASAQSGLVAAYSFDEATGSTVADASGLNNIGSIGSGVMRTTFGKFGGALVFNGTSGRVTIANAPSLMLTSAVTLEAWVKPSAVTNTWRDVIFKADDNYYLMASTNTNSRPAGGGLFSGNSNTTKAVGTTALANNAWSHLAVTYDGATIRLYVNGTLVSSTAKTGSFTTSSNPLTIGGDAIYGQFFQGTIDEVRIYNRALSAAEVQTDMATAVGAPPVDNASPAISITTPTTGASYLTNAGTLTVGGTASDNVGVTQVSWTNDRGGSGTASGTTSWSASGITLQPGANVITVTARDAANNAASATLIVTQDVTVPMVALTAPSAGSSVSGPAVTVSASASDNNAVAGVQLLLDGVALDSELTGAGPTYTFSWNSLSAVNGSHTLSARARDAAGNTAVSAGVAVSVSNGQPSGLVAAFGFEETSGSSVVDGSGSDNSGTFATGVTRTTSGKFGGALVFNGSSGMVTIPNSTSLSLTTAMTLEAWVNPSSAVNDWRDVVYKANDNYFLMAWTNSSSRPAGGGTFGGGSSTTEAFGTSSLPTNTWSHLAVTYDGATIRFYVNGSQVSSLARTGALTTSANPLTIGGDAIYGQFFQGTIDEVRVYSRALSATEVQADMTTPVGTTVSDNIAPVVAFTTPVNGSSYSTSSNTIDVGGTASDNVGVGQVTWTNDRGGSGTASGTASWSVGGIALQAGTNVLTVTARDAANNAGTTTLAVTYTPPDVTPPTVGITSPTTGSTFLTKATSVSLSGSSSDNIAVTQVTWTNDRGGSGTATGTTSWAISTVALQPGANVITVTARDAAANVATGTLTVTQDAVVPVVAVTAPTTTGSFTTTATSLAVSGTASDASGVTQVSWTNDRGGTGVASGTADWSVAGIALQPGVNVLRISARDAASNVGTATLTVTSNIPDNTAPTVVITGPTGVANYTTGGTSIALSGTSSDDVGVTQVSWANDRGGSGVATGTTSWSTPPIALQPGINVLTVTARDAASNTGTASLTVTLDVTAPTVTVTAPNAGANVSGTSVTVSATASDDNAVAGVQFLLDGSPLGSEVTGTGPYNFVWNTVGVPNGAHVLSARARDAVGNTAVAPDVGVTVANATPGLVAAYSFNETSGSTTADGSSFNNVGTIGSGVTRTTSGKFGGALVFNGTSGKVTIPNSASLSLTSGMTLEAWVNPSVAINDWRDVIYKGDDNYYLMAWTNNSSRPAGGATFAGTSGSVQAFGMASLARNTWSHIAVTYDGAQLRFYLNGAQVASTAKTGAMVTSTNPLTIGGDAIYGQFFQGTIDEVRIYSRALSVAELQADMTTAISGAVDASAPVVAISTPTAGSSYATAISTLSLAGTASDDVGVTQVSWTNDRGGAGTATGTTSWSASGIALQAGVNVLTVTARDAANNVGTSTLRVTMDAVAPTVTLTAPGAGATVSGAAVSLTASASDDNVLAGVQFLLDGAPIGSEVLGAGPTFTSSWNSTSTSNGSHTLAARARDAAGNTAVSAAVPVTVSNAAASGLVAAYGFEEPSGNTVVDASGNNNNGTFAAGVQRISGGRSGWALFFDGNSGVVNVPSSASLSLTTGMTLEAWVNPTTIDAHWRDVVYKGNDNYFLMASSSSPNPAGGGIINGGATTVAFGTSPLPTGTWSHIAVTYDGSAVRLYKNGTLLSSVAKTGNIATTSNPLQIGGDNFYSQYFQGAIDEVRVYSRALSATELQTDMTAPVTDPLPPPLASSVGAWSAPFAWPIVDIHAVVVKTGEVMVWEYNGAGGPFLWNPTTGAFTEVRPTSTSNNLFCAGMAALPDGRILIAGGHVDSHVGLNEINIFDPAGRTWQSAPKMDVGRWYPTVTTMPDGRALIMSGESNCDGCNVLVPEVYDPLTNAVSKLTGAAMNFTYYPHNFVLPDGRIITAGSAETPVVTKVLDVATQTWSVVDPVAVDGGSSVMYLPGKIMKTGTSHNPDLPPEPSAANTYVLDMTGTSPAWQATQPMANPRTYLTLTVLPDGNVLATGGGVTTDPQTLSNAVLAAELWSPATKTWQTLSSMTIARLYHSTAVLLPDARVLVAGGGRFNGFPATGQFEHTDAEIYSPAYLYKGARPVITSAPSSATYGSTIAVQTADAASIASASLIRLAAVTHAFNAEQRFLPLTFSTKPDGLNVQMPATANLAPPGYYMLFILNGDGVPSVASIIQVK